MICTLILIGTMWLNPCEVRNIEVRKDKCVIYMPHDPYRHIVKADCTEAANKINAAIEKEWIGK